MADNQFKEELSDNEKLSRVFKLLADTLDKRQKDFRKRNWGSVTRIRPWKIWSLVGLMAVMLAQVVAVYANLGMARTVWFFALFLACCFLATILLPITFIQREELKRETPQETMRTLSDEAAEELEVSQKLHDVADPQTRKRAYAKIGSDLGLLEARRNFMSDLLKDIGPTFTALGAVLKLMGLSAPINSLMTTAILLFGATAILIRFAVILVIQPHLMRRKKFLIILEQAEALEPKASRK